MNNRLQAILNLIQQSESLTPEEKKSLADAVKESDKEITITEFKLERTEKVKRTTAILLEETIAELEQKRKSVETQNRELEIEAALERVRSRSMAMHTSTELQEVIKTVTDQISALGLKFDNANFAKVYPDGSWDLWISSAQSYPAQIHVPYFEHNMFKSLNDVAAKGFDFHADVYGYEEKNSFFRHFFENTVAKNIPEERKQYLLNSKGLARSAFFAKNIWLAVINYDAIPYTTEENAIFKRFAYVFEQTYTRFLDLQKAEAQAREAKIEAALEKIRSRTMAMQHSDELRDAAISLFLQVQALGIPAWATGYCIWDEDKQGITIWMSSEGVMQPPIHAPLTVDPSFIHMKEAYERGDGFHVEGVGGEALKSHYKYMRTLPVVGETIDSIIAAGHGLPTFQIFHSVYFSQGFLLFTTYEPVPEAHDIFKRFGKVFDQTYTRFLDLQKAEAQAREAKIEAALEKVRSRTMAMQRSEGLVDVASVLFQQVKALGVPQWNCGFNIWDIGDKEFTYYPGSPDGIILPTPSKIPLTEHPVFISFDESRKRGDELFVYEKEGEFQADHYRYMLSLRPGVGDLLQSMLDAGFQLPAFQIDHIANFSYGNLIFITYEPFPEMHDVFKRFAKVFEQTYTRFLDLKKAEAQAREAQIEAALERVRSKTMAMHNSQDVGDTVATLFDELKKLGVKTNRCGILIFSDSNITEVWTAKSTPSGEANLIIGHLDVALHPMLTRARNTWKNKETSFSYEMIGDDLINYYESIANQPGYPMPVNMKTLPSKEFHSDFYFPEGAVFVFTAEPIAVDDVQIFKRLAGVFGQTYRRYLDLLKAEAQAREAQIEAALERVRSRTMAMHRSEEIADILGKIFKELTLLDVALNRVLIWIFNPEEKYISWWSSNPEAESNAESYRVDYNDHPVFLAYFEAWQKRQPLLLYTLGGTLKESWEDHLFQNTELSRLPKAVQDGMRSEGKIFTTSAISDYGLMMAGCFEPFPDEINDIVQRFGRVFQQSYTRYVDVQKAEAQAREATIEASLEKVRGKAMAMHNSNDLIATASLVFTELRNLGIKSFRSGVGLLTKENRKVKLYSATSSEEGDSLSLVGWATLDDHSVLKDFYDTWIRNEDYFPVLRGEEIKSYYEKVVSNFSVPVAQTVGVEQHGCVLPFSEGLFYGWSEKPYTEAEIKILHRFKAIVDLTFRRYMELQKSEANAVEAIRQASLDRVRAEIASMRTTNDLDRITPLIWKELNILSIPFVRCGVFIMDERQRQIHTFLSAPDGKAIAAFHLPYDSPGNIREILSHWVSKKMYIRHWDQTAFSELGDLLVQQGALPSKEIYMSTIPPEGIHLHCLPFLQGMLYVGNTTKLKEDDIHLIQSVADAFATAYARYEDFNKLESANIQIEKTLMDLKQTQAQLVQSEKMASLGELTAGIAHEIQNPLNFVNNFSEVNKELLTEIEDEITKGNFGELKGIIKDAISNEEKISHHGKRADAIVKGMLQHSRTSNGVKEPTDINALSEEYLRLAYHGLRAKDKSFNASTKTNFDETIGNININPQDIGRVILNLITNAFYAVTEKKKQQPEGQPDYEPTVSIRTKKLGDKVLIYVKDNGNGIPSKVLNKIFQPFFTTKPAGQGTGLGLSLSYDIVKAHGGEIKVHTKENEGTEFTIQLPTV